MPLPRRARVLAAGSALVLAAGLLLTTMPAAADPPDPTPTVPGRYIVTLSGSPIATYAGEVKGYKATRPTKGRKVSASSASAKAYRKYLEKQQDRAAARVGAKADRHYAVALNGFTTALTPAQAKRLEKAPGVLSVVKDTPRHLTDDKNPVDYLRLSGSNGVWASLGGVSKAGAGTVVGVLDSGYWPESPSFAGAALGTAEPTPGDPYRPYKVGNQIRMDKADGNTFTGVCQAGAGFASTECNQKVIGARYFADTYRENTPGRGGGRVHLPARRRRPRQPHGVDRRGQRQCHGHRERPELRQDLRRRPGRQDRGLQGLLHPGLLQRRHPGGHRRGHPRRCRRDQLLDQRQ